MPTPHGSSTRLVHAGERRPKPQHAITTPIFQTSTYTFANTREMVEFMEAQARGEPAARQEYGRYGNPTVAACEERMAGLEGGDAALLFSSGMAAVTVSLLTLLSAGTHLICTDDCYRRTRQLVTELLAAYSVEATFVPPGDYEALEAAIRPNTRLIFSETPTNPRLRVPDVERVGEIARRHRILTLIDSTCATPINLRPLELGADLVIHSATKYLGGHNDLLAGVVVASEERIVALRRTQGLIGAVCDPHCAYLLLRGLKTLDLRVTHQNRAGMGVARFLEEHPRVRRVHYPGLSSHPDHAVARRQMSGFGGVISFELDADLDTTSRFVDALQIPQIGPSFGGAEALVEQVALASYYDFSRQERAEIGISDGLVRLAVGIEDESDVVEDLEQALRRTLDPKRAPR